MNNKILIFFAVFCGGLVNAQENAQTRIPTSLLECYQEPRLMQRDSRLPMTINILIDLIRKVENYPGLNMEIRTIVIDLLHRFRLDGIVRASSLSASSNVLPYSPKGFQFYKHRILLSNLITGNTYNFPNDSLSSLEKCSMHHILSHTIEEESRGDEGTVCNRMSQYRTQRLPRDTSDVEVMDTHTVDDMNKRGSFKFAPDTEDGEVDLNFIPAAFPKDATEPVRSQCPVETGVMRTTWGAVSAGTLLAGIAAGLQPLKVSVSDLSERLSKNLETETKKIIIDNKFAATLAGDLAEAALLIGPQTDITNNRIDMSVGAGGGWNSTQAPKWYFLSQSKDFEFTDAEIRGGLDGLILGTYIEEFRRKASSIKLSQLLDMYYSQRGVFSNKFRACNRQTLVPEVAPSEVILSEALGFSYVLDKIMQLPGTISDRGFVSYSTLAANALAKYIPSSLNDLSCLATETANNYDVEVATNIYLVLDTTWEYHNIYPSLSYLLDNLDISHLNSNFTLINGNDGKLIIDSSWSLSNFHEFYNVTIHQELSRGFQLTTVLEKIQQLQEECLNRERSIKSGGGTSSIVLMVVNQATIDSAAENFAIERLKIFSETIPDMKFLYLTAGSRERFTNLVKEPEKDIFSLTVSSSDSTSSQINNAVNRIKDVSRRLINPRCGSDWTPTDSGTTTLVQYVAPSMINYYKLHPNYFYKLNGNGMVKIQGHGFGGLTVCRSRYVELPRRSNSSSGNEDIVCDSVTGNTLDINLGDACNKKKYIHKCEPLYISVEAIAVQEVTTARCTEKGCRFPDAVKYTVHLQELGCFSSAIRSFASSLALLLAISITVKSFLL
ncbi:uncharacterized protein LOC143917878 [Arctopsyche grandis]|uniref:uncharacterized protein LOC143917878 n=1 Tax=Arctopsyche grandis TaxID=121162 RepID=UPI00406D6EF6